MTFKAPDSLAEQIAHYLAERIIRGELKERERIQEQKVTQALNVSRGSVREALLILERRHLIFLESRRVCARVLCAGSRSRSQSAARL